MRPSGFYTDVEMVGYTHAIEGKAVERERFQAESIVVEADLLKRGVRERTK